MPNKLLEEIKNLGYDHDQVLEILKKQKEAEGTESQDNDEPEESNEEQAPEQEPNDEVPKNEGIDINKITEDLKKEVENITKDLKSKYAMLRSKPPKGVESDKPVDNKPLVTKNLFEVRI